MTTTKTLDQIDADLRRANASLEGARAAHRRCPNADNADRVACLTALIDRILEHRYSRQTADALVR